ncbi:UNKNOWN [Stylonychia lemnae]|uniref:Uncharacterized protein n=1 Tax=Stylonychia lemnae TaxID=5949 RepID=A0A078AAS7_STYLE|nr:UNKNOWN [Stylonychia lemnae]|eukprot:CDW78712.1 UNKNOWN [Stylonychia lemnae]
MLDVVSLHFAAPSLNVSQAVYATMDKNKVQTCKCEANKDCSSGCCSFGFCSSTSLCEGRKVENDYCDDKSECQNTSCLNNKCLPEDPVINNQAIIGIVIIIAACFSTAFIYCCLCRNKDGGEGGRRRSNGRDLDNVDGTSLLNQSREHSNSARNRRATDERNNAQN